MPLISIRDKSIFSLRCELDLIQREEDAGLKTHTSKTKYYFWFFSSQCWNVALLTVWWEVLLWLILENIYKSTMNDKLQLEVQYMRLQMFTLSYSQNVASSENTMDKIADVSEQYWSLQRSFQMQVEHWWSILHVPSYDILNQPLNY